MLFATVAIAFVVASCTKENEGTNPDNPSNVSEESIVGKTLYTDLYCTMLGIDYYIGDGYVNYQYEFRFSADNTLYIREGRKIQSTGEMRWSDPIRWSYTIDNSLITIEGDYDNDHAIKMGTIINAETIKWEGQRTLNEDDEKVINFADVFKYGLTISTRPQTVTSQCFGWEFEGYCEYYCHYLYGNWEYSNVKMAFGRNHVKWGQENKLYSNFYWKIKINYPSIVFYEDNDNNGVDTIACGQFMNNDQTLQLHHYVNGAPSSDTLFTVTYTRCN